MTAVLAAFLFGVGVVLGFALAAVSIFLRPAGKPALSLVGSTAVNAQIPPSKSSADYPFKPYYPTPEEEANVGSVSRVTEAHEPMEASRR